MRAHHLGRETGFFEQRAERMQWRQRLGVLVVLIWLPLVVVGFWWQFVRTLPHHGWPDAQQQVMAWERWFRSAEAGREGGPTVVMATQVDAVACPCAQLDGAQQRAARRRWAGTPVHFREANGLAPTLPDGVEALVFSSQGRLLYAGPWRTESWCGAANSSLMDAAIAAGLSQARTTTFGAPILLRARCACAES